MSIYGIGNSNIQRPISNFPVRDGGRTQVQTPAASPHRLPVQPPATQPQTPANAKAAQQAVPADPPSGTDPALWSILSSEERSFFAKAGAMGPLPYGRAMREMQAAQLPASRGGRLEVKI